MEEKQVLLAKNMDPDRFEWEKLGFLFQSIDGNHVMYKATLPEGWRLEPTDHSMYFDLFDEYGNRRGQMFHNPYKGFATMSLFHKYGVYADFDKETFTIGYYFGNAEEKLFETERISPYERKNIYEADLKMLCLKFADDNYPESWSYSAYWDKGPNLSKKQTTI